MSVLDGPRVTFRGQVSWDPITTNNYAQLYDENNSNGAGIVYFPPGADANAYRQQAVAGVTTMGNWNPDGSHRSTFFGVKVAGVDVDGTFNTDDSLCRSPVNFIGMLVDAEPFGSYTSQLFFDTMTFGIDGDCQVRLPRQSRMAARYINFARNVNYGYIAGGASVVWQTSFPKAGSKPLKIHAHGSQVLAALQRSLNEDEDVLGLTVRWTAYRTQYYDTFNLGEMPARQKALQQKLEKGGFQPNPARSELVGVLGLWRKGEPPSEPGDRALLMPDDPPSITAKPASGDYTPEPVTVASAHLRISEPRSSEAAPRLTLDLMNSIPEWSSSDLSKVDLGTLEIVASSGDAGGTSMSLGQFGLSSYDRAAYEITAGLVSLPLTREQADFARSADLELRQADGTVLLKEGPLRAIPTVQNTYIDQGQSKPLQVLVLQRGAPAPAGVPVALVRDSASERVQFVAETDGQGIATFMLSGIAGQIEGYVLVPGEASKLTDPMTIDTQRTTYAYVRTHAADAHIAAKHPTWQNVYSHVLQNWRALAPCMDNWLRLDDEAQVRSFKDILTKVTDPDHFESFHYMPVTRDMTPGMRSLLLKFLDAPADPALAAGAVGGQRQAAATDKMKSRALRQG